MIQQSVSRSLDASTRELSNNFHTGSRFAFLDLEQMPKDVRLSGEIHPEIARATEGRFTIPLPLNKDTFIAGIALWPHQHSELRLRLIHSDRVLYRSGEDTVHLLVVDLERTNRSIPIDLLSGQHIMQQYMVELDQYGMGTLQLRDLPIGVYSVRWPRTSEEGSCQFRVAGFELAPLAASLRRMQLHGTDLCVMLQLQRFGRPYDGRVRIDLFNRGPASQRLDGGIRIDSRWSHAHNGLVQATVELTGQGPHQLHVSLCDHRESTATVNLPGTGQQQRKDTILSIAGRRISVSMLPRRGSIEARGLHFVSAEMEAGPIEVQHVASDTIAIGFLKPVHDFCMIVNQLPMNTADEQIRRWPCLDAGEVIHVDSPSPMGILSFGGFCDNQPWEDRIVAVRPSGMLTKIQVNGVDATNQESCTVVAGRTVDVQLSTRLKIDGVAHILVKDTRLQSQSSPEELLADQMKTAATLASAGRQSIIPFQRFNPNSPSRYRCAFSSLWFPDHAFKRFVELGILTEDQVDSLSGSGNVSQLIDLGYVDEESLFRAAALAAECEYIDLSSIDIGDEILELCPESLSRDSHAIAYQDNEPALHFAIANPWDVETIEKLRFVLNRPVTFSIASPSSITRALNCYYGSVLGESADSMLQEFCDTSIDFTDTVDDLVDDDLEDHPTETVSEALDVLACFHTPIVNGQASFPLNVPKGCRRYQLQAFALSGMDWSQMTVQLDASEDLSVELSCPDQMYANDVAVGRLVAHCVNGPMQLTLTHNGEPIESEALASPISDQPFELTFPITPGTYKATVVNLSDGQSATDIQHVQQFGKIIRQRRTIKILNPGEVIGIGDTVQTINVLPETSTITCRVAKATADYQHLCCEQTAAKLFASFAILSYHVLRGQANNDAITTIRVGLNREKRMWKPGSGFSLYPGQFSFSAWGREAARHLLQIEAFKPALRQNSQAFDLFKETRQLARNAAKHYEIPWPIRKPKSLFEAYLATTSKNHDVAACVAFAHQRINRPRSHDTVRWRADMALAAALLLRVGTHRDIGVAREAANHVLEALNDHDRLYSTFDSVAAIALLNEISRLSPGDSTTVVRVNGEEKSLGQLLQSEIRVLEIAAVETSLPVELCVQESVDWTIAEGFPLRVRLRETRTGNRENKFREGDRVTLGIENPGGYKAGDLIWISLPPYLSKLEGGGLVKQFEIDMKGSQSINVPLVATGASFISGQPECPQHMIVCLGNMYDEYRRANPGPLPVTVDPLN